MTNENDWVTQDVVPPRNNIDQFQYIHSEWETKWMFAVDSDNWEQVKHGWLDDDGSVLQVRCKRKDHPVLGKAKIRMVSQDELNAAPRTRAWTFGKPALTGHFLISHRDPAMHPQEITATTLDDSRLGFVYAIWFVYLGQTSDFVDPVVPKTKYTLLKHPNSPRAGWYSKPSMIQDKLDAGWTIVAEREFEVPEWDR